MTALRERLKKFDSLVARMVGSFIVVLLLTAVAAWTPEYWLIRSQFERQIWAQLDQGRRAARALYHSWQSEVSNAAILSAQLPTLQNLLAEDARESLTAYLERVQSSLDLDLVAVCNDSHEVAAQVGEHFVGDVCALESPVGFHASSTTSEPAAWLLAVQPILLRSPTPDMGDSRLGKIVAGIQLDEAFMARMHAETELEHTLLLGSQPIATSIEGGLSSWRRSTEGQPGNGTLVEANSQAENAGRRVFSLDDRPYYAVRLPLSDFGLEDEVALSAVQIVSTERNLARTGTISALVAVFLGSAIGVLVARRISNPLVSLSQAAVRLSQGDLEPRIATKANVREVQALAEALEHARIDLRHTLQTLQQEKAWVEHLLGAIVEGIMTLDEEGRINFFSQGAEAITGWKESEVLQRASSDVFRPADTDRPFSELIPEPGKRRKIGVMLADGRTAVLSVTRAQLTPPEAGAARIALVFRDITDEEAAQRMLGNFLANVTHEFRTPLTALAASAELLVDQAHDLSQAQLEQMLNWLHLGILGLQTLVDNLLETASLEAGRFHVSPRPTDLKEIISEAAGVMRPLLEKYDQKLVVEMPAAIPPVLADPRRMVQVLVNLISNANKFSPEETEITLTVKALSGRLRLAVADQGSGVPSVYQSSLFHRFAHLEANGDGQQYGVGLGLWVVKATVEGHGGEVGFQERPGGGSIFWFTLPLVEGNESSRR